MPIVDQPSAVYQPGVCNIGPAEIRSRRMVGVVGAAVTVALLAGFVIFSVSDGWRWLVIAPAAVSAMGFLQAAFHFCARFGMAGLFNFGTLGDHEEVHEHEFRQKDQRKAVLISSLSLAIGVAIAVIAMVLP